MVTHQLLIGIDREVRRPVMTEPLLLVTAPFAA